MKRMDITWWELCFRLTKTRVYGSYCLDAHTLECWSSAKIMLVPAWINVIPVVLFGGQLPRHLTPDQCMFTHRMEHRDIHDPSTNQRMSESVWNVWIDRPMHSALQTYTHSQRVRGSWYFREMF